MAVGPPRLPYAWGNPSDTEDLCMVSEHRPALRTEEMLEGGFTIARDLQADKRGAMKHLLRMAVLLDDIEDDFYMSRAPAQVLLRAFASLSLIGRLLGYEPLRSEGRRGAASRVGGVVAVGSGLLLLMLWWRKRLRSR